MGVECYYRIVEQALACPTVSPESAAANLALDEQLLLTKTSSSLGFWESEQPVVVLGRSGRITEQVNQQACAVDNIEILRRCSGGGAVVLGPGCLNYSLLFSL